MNIRNIHHSHPGRLVSNGVKLFNQIRYKKQETPKDKPTGQARYKCRFHRASSAKPGQIPITNNQNSKPTIKPSNHPTSKLITFVVICVLVLLSAVICVPAYAETVIHDTSEEFNGTFSNTEKTGNPALKIVYNVLPWTVSDSFGDGHNGSTSISSDPNSRASCYGTTGTKKVYTGLSASANDIILIHQSRGTGAGNWELNKVVNDAGTYLNLVNNLSHTYTDSGASQAQAVLVPQYSSLTISGGGPAVWGGNVGGIYAVICNGTVNVSGTLSATGKGFAGGTGNNSSEGDTGSYGSQGEGIAGVGSQTRSANGNGGGGGTVAGSAHGAAGGGGNGASGVNGVDDGNNGTGKPGIGGSIAGNNTLTLFSLGGGGGGARQWESGSAGSGGRGAGGVIILARAITIAGSIQAKGSNGGSSSCNASKPDDRKRSMNAGGGAGGSVLLKGETINISTNKINTQAGSGATGGGSCWQTFNGGSGGKGRICIEKRSLTGSVASTYYGTYLTPTLPYKTAGTYLSGAVSIAGCTSFGTLVWSQGGTDIDIKTRTSSNGSDWGSWSASHENSGSAITSPANEYIQYEASFAGTTSDSPTLNSVTINYATNSVPNNPANLEQSVGWGAWTNDNPTLEFDLSDPDSGNTLKYRIQISKVSNYASTEVNHLSGTIGATPQNNVQYTPSTLSDSSTYYWRVKGIDQESAEGNYAEANSGAIAFKIDTVNPSVTVDSISEVTGQGYQYATGTTLYYNSAQSGSFSINTSLTDTAGSANSGAQKVNFPDLISYNISGGGDETSPYDHTYTWTSSASGSPGAKNVTGYDNADNTHTASFTITEDITAPGDPSGLSTTPTTSSTSYSTNTTPTFTWTTDGTDGGSGIDKHQAKVNSGSWSDFTKGNTVTVVSQSAANTIYARAVDNVSNSSSGVASINYYCDTSAPTSVSVTSIDEGSNPEYQYATGTTLYYNPNYTGSFTVNATAIDSESRIQKINFPSLGTGFSGEGDDTTSPYAATYSWNTSATTSPESENATAYNKADSTTTASFTITKDATTPTGSSLSFGTITKSSIPVAASGATDAGSGLPTSHYKFERDTGTSFSADEAGNVYGPDSWTDSGLAANTAYTYQLKTIDRVGNVDTTSTQTRYTHANVPSSLSATGDWDSSNSYHLDLSWSGDGTTYQIEYSLDNSTWYNPFGMTWQSGTTYVFKKDKDNNDLSSDTTYYLKVKAQNGDDVPTNSSGSQSDSTPTDKPTISNLSLTQIGEEEDTRIQISYTLSDVPEEDCNIEVEWSSDGTNWHSATISGTTTSLTSTYQGTAHSALYWNCGNIGSAYYVRMRAHDGSQWGAWFTSGALEIKQPGYDAVSDWFGGCFIATAAYGTPLASEVRVLSHFRDQYLLTNPVGQALVRFYYKHSPGAAAFISRHEPLRAITRFYLKPLVWLTR